MKLPQYENKPFKSPLIASKSTQSTGPAVISRNVAPTAVNSAPNRTVNKRSFVNTAPSQTAKKASNAINYYSITYRKRTTKKNKTWDGDGSAIELSNDTFRFYKESGQFIGSGNLGTCDDKFEKVFGCSGFEVQLDHLIDDQSEIIQLAALLGKSCDSSKDSSLKSKSLSPTLSQTLVPIIPVRKFKPAARTPHLVGTDSDDKTKTYEFKPLFNTSKIENPLIMNRFREAEVDVVVDPILSKHLRTHQRVGVKFMYDCVMGLSRATDYNEDGQTCATLEKTDDVHGCLLADEMGLGKTLMTIALIWTLIKQTPLPSRTTSSQFGISHQGVCNKILVVCPVTLIGNWKREFAKWLNLNRVGVLTLSSKSTPDKDKLDVRNFLKVQRSYQVLIIGYEKLLSVSDALIEGKANIGLLVCDEGHRLKNGQSKTLNALNSIDVSRKILLTGTPIQNDLVEFYTILNFLNDGILGSFPKFKRDFILPITRSRDVNSRFNELIQEKGRERTNELIEITKRFTLRRTSDTIAKFLPPKTDVILFCKPALSQVQAFETVLTKCRLDFSNMAYTSSLGLITLFKKICNSPALISQDPFYREKVKPTVDLTRGQNLDSGKLKVLMSVLNCIRSFDAEEKVVIVSNYTQTLDVIQNMLNSHSLSNTRLDGSTPTKERDGIVNNFNTLPSIFAFLLSAKSGGVGLNLIGASRLVLFDNDWNPAIDHQAMSRIHRDGQKKSCYIYRLLTAGCIDEKIFQRQLMKNSLSAKFMGGEDNVSNNKSDNDLFENEDLKDLFTVLATTSNTHDLICECEGDGEYDTRSNSTTDDDQQDTIISADGWTNAMDLQASLKKAQKVNDTQKAALVKECLTGYRHITPRKETELSEELAVKWNPDITFAFLKEFRA
ncbi:LANO_0F13036g1_1 [Lachancea nothofagi CBS 11611]|uniref:DNA repair and recombination protein RDH54 n=1 Tax=Lachancea nothofagi CBS 11611 TaxID=1266666 RepID=A0A1G4KBQ4_9SACH|nr:LANO_0F13036g1_1 [Lachancea nothofagi CBS 11611]